MESRILKRRIGSIYFLAVAMIFLLLIIRPIAFDFRRLILCYSFAFLGLGIRAFFYYGFIKKDENENLSKEKMKKCIKDYFIYGITSLFVFSLVYLIWFNHFLQMSYLTFYFISAPLFIYGGFRIDQFFNNQFFKNIFGIKE